MQAIAAWRQAVGWHQAASWWYSTTVHFERSIAVERPVDFEHLSGVGALTKKTEDCTALLDNFIADWPRVLSCAGQAVRDGLQELASLFALGVLKKRELGCLLQVFTRVLAPVAKWLHLMGINICLCLNDWLRRSPLRNRCTEDLKKALSLVQDLGFLINFSKSQLVTTQVIIYLGMMIDSQSFWAFMSEKNSFLPADNSEISRSSFLPSQRLDEPLGHSFVYREVYAVRKTKDLQGWLGDERFLVGKSLFPLNPNLTLFSDTSHLGWGAHLQDLEVAGTWSQEERLLYISAKELKAIHLALQHFASVTHSKIIAGHSDNTMALAYIRNQGGMHSFSLCQAARDLIWAQDNHTQIITRFIQGKMNVLADIEESSSSPVLLISSRPLAWATDTMPQEWSDLNMYGFPPFSMVREVINQFQSLSNSSMTLVAPLWWTSQDFFHSIEVFSNSLISSAIIKVCPLLL
ncbi:uncharacterized protein [Macrobrachium rosenbergii]|uniref:uncharacterized protein n=1 Tax=Macrobrachium rosenbergii TaxID=79674 RepID=UPI0034D55AD0